MSVPPQTAQEQFAELYSHIKRGRIAALKDFLDRGGDPNLSTPHGWNLLMVASYKGSSQMSKLLLDRGAALESATVDGETALALAVGGGYTQCVKLLLERGASTEIRPLGQPLSVYMEYCGGPYPNIQSLLAGAGAA